MKNFAWILLAASLAIPEAKAQSGAELFEKNCAGCHKAGSATHAPAPEALRQLSRARIFDALTTGKMILVAGVAAGDAAHDDRRLFGREGAGGGQRRPCQASPAPLADLRGWHGWSVDPENSRMQSAAAAGLGPAEVGKLKLKWAFGFPGATSALGQPSAADGRLFVGSAGGAVYALDARTGCTYWTFHAAQTVRTAINVAPYRQRPPRGVFRRRAVHRLRRGCGFGRAALENARGRASFLAHHRQPGALRRAAVCAGLDRRRGVRGGRRPEIQVLHGARQRGGAGCAQRRAPLEDIHDSRAETYARELGRHADDGTIGRIGVVRARLST